MSSTESLRHEHFKSNYQKALETIDAYGNRGNELSTFIQWMLATNANPYSFLENRYAGGFNSAEGFASLVMELSHSLYDDGEISFIMVTNLPKIFFIDQREDHVLDYVLEDEGSSFLKKEHIKFLDITIDQFGEVYDQHHIAEIKNCFIHDAAMKGMEFAIKHYSDYDFFSEEWVDECKPQIDERVESLKRAKIL